jgi:hypothetical protein
VKEAFSLKRIGIAVLIAAAIYGVALGIGSLLYASGTIATGATHNDCAEYRKEIAEERGIDEEDVPQEEIKNRTAACLETHELTEKEAFRSEYLFWSVWPGVICGIVFLFWPVWTRILIRQEEHEEREPRTGAGGEHRTASNA